MKGIALLSLLLLVNTIVATAQIMVWDFTSINGNEDSVGVSTLDPGLDTSFIYRGSGLNGSLVSDVFNSSNFDPLSVSLPDAIADQQYLEFTAKAAPGKVIFLQAIRPKFRRSSAGPTKFQWQYSLDGFSTAGTNIGNEILFEDTDANGKWMDTLDLAIFPDLQYVSDNTVITFRLHGYNSSSNSGRFGLGANRALDIYGFVHPENDPGIFVLSPAGNLITPVNTTSETGSYIVTALNLYEDLTIAPPPGIEISLDGTGFTSGTIDLAPNNGKIDPVEIFYRYVPTSLEEGVLNIGNSSSGVNTFFPVSVISFGNYYSVASGTHNDGTVWSETPGGSPVTPHFNRYNSFQVSSNDTIELGNAATLNNLVIKSGGVLHRTASTIRYLRVYGDVTVDGTLGSSAHSTSLGLNFNGENQLFIGNGVVEVATIRKDEVIFPETNLSVHSSLKLFGQSSIYNNSSSNSAFNITIEEGAIVEAINVSIDGPAGGSSPLRGGSITVLGELVVDSILFLSTNNGNIERPCSVAILSNGIIRANSISASSSGNATHTLFIAEGGKLQITSDPGFIAFGSENNHFEFESGAVIKVTASGNVELPDQLTYPHLRISGNANIELDGNFQIRGNLELNNANLSLNDKELVIEGNLQMSDGYLFNAGTGKIIFEGDSLQSIHSTTGIPELYNLEVKNAENLELNSPVRVLGTLSLTEGKILTSQSAPLILMETASVSGGTDQSYISGPLICHTASTGVYEFPVGAGNRLRKAAIIPATSDPAEFRVEAIDSAYPDITNLEPGIQNVSQVEYWMIERIDGSTNAQARLYWHSQSGVDDPSEVFVVHYSGSQWENAGGAGGGNGTTTAGYVNSGLITSFSPFTFGSSDNGVNPLPVNWLYFTAKIESDHVKLEWATAREYENDFFEIEKSRDGQQFLSIGRVNGSGTDHSPNFYTTHDMDPYPANFYRIRQVDFDGSFEYSHVVFVSFSPKDGYQLVVFPNPVKDQLNLSMGSGELKPQKIKLMDLKGRKLMVNREPQINGTTIIAADLAGLPAGKYLLVVYFEHEIEVMPFIKQ